MGTEIANSIPIEVIDSNTTPIPSNCKAIGPAEEDVSSLGANGILGIGFFLQDCGSACSVPGSSNPGFYYSCSGVRARSPPRAIHYKCKTRWDFSQPITTVWSCTGRLNIRCNRDRFAYIRRSEQQNNNAINSQLIALSSGRARAVPRGHPAGGGGPAGESGRPGAHLRLRAQPGSTEGRSGDRVPAGDPAPVR